MNSNRQLEIIMKFKDEVSKKLTEIQGSLQKFSNSMHEIGKNMRQVGKEISQVGSAMSMAGAALTGPLMLAFKNAAQYSIAVSNQIDRLKNVTDQFQVSLATALVPIMEKVTDVLGGLLNAWNGLGPVVQQQIVQGAFIVGLFMTIGGAATFLIGKLVTIGGTIVMLTSQFIGFAAANLYILPVIASLAILLALMLKFKPVADTIMSTLQVLFLYFLNGLETIRLALSRLIAFWLGQWEKVFTFLSRIPGFAGQIFDGMAKGVKTVREEVDKLGDGALVHLKNNTEEVGKIFTTGQGSWSEGFDRLKTGISDIWDLMRNPPHVDIQPVVKQFDFMKDIAQGTAQAMTQSFGNLFFNVFTGQLNNIKTVFADFGKQLLQILSQAMAKFILVKTIGSAFPSIGKYLFHQGGIIRAHNGLAIDEVPIIAQTGEGVLSRKGMSALGRNNFDKLNSGIGVGGGNVTYNPVIVIQSLSPNDFVKNKQAIQAIFLDALRKNSPMRGAVKNV